MTPTASPPIDTLSDLFERLGDVPPHRIRFRPWPGNATIQDVIEVHRLQGKLCELVVGVLVEKASGFRDSQLADFLCYCLIPFVNPRNLGIVTGASGPVELMPDLVRIPDVAFTGWDRLPGRRCPTAPIPRVVPNLVVEALNQKNTPGEMAAKRRDYFTAGVEVVWEIDPDTRTVDVYTSPTHSTTLTVADTLDGGVALPGFAMPVQALFAELDRQG